MIDPATLTERIRRLAISEPDRERLATWVEMTARELG
jgi:hypothetical protein